MVNETIFARATAPGKAGVAVIRISGPDALKAVEHFGREKPPAPRHAILHAFKVKDEFIDSGLILYFKAPNSFTGEEVIEFQLHGGTAITNRVMKELSALPSFRLANPGEFSQRAFLNQKMDLVQAEGLVDLINAETERQRLQAARLTQGHASHFFESLRSRMIEPMAMMEAYIDFPEEEIPEELTREIDENIKKLQQDIHYQLQHGKGAELLRDGFTVLLVGKPNSGKSTLLNRIIGRDAAIVTEQAGTTRDLIEVQCDIHGIPITLIDTAGLRESDDEIEQEGVKRTKNRIANADIVLYLIDGADSSISDEQEITPDYHIATKSDIAPTPAFPYDHKLSANTGEGVDQLMEILSERLEASLPPADCLALHQRHIDLLERASHSLSQFSETKILEIKAEYLRQAANELSDIIGSHDVEDLLDIIFSTFCIGK